MTYELLSQSKKVNKQGERRSGGGGGGVGGWSLIRAGWEVGKLFEEKSDKREGTPIRNPRVGKSPTFSFSI